MCSYQILTWLCSNVVTLVLNNCIRDLTPEEAWNKRDLFDKLSIENWILPGCFVGVFSTIVWVCPPWSDQVSITSNLEKQQSVLNFKLIILERISWIIQNDLEFYQIDPGEHEFYVGVERGTDRLAVSCLQVLFCQHSQSVSNYVQFSGNRWITQSPPELLYQWGTVCSTEGSW